MIATPDALLLRQRSAFLLFVTLEGGAPSCTLKVDILHSVDSLQCLVSEFRHLNEVHLIVEYMEMSNRLSEYVQKLAVIIEKFRPGLVVS